jgi:hypothetical protein
MPTGCAAEKRFAPMKPSGTGRPEGPPEWPLPSEGRALGMARKLAEQFACGGRLETARSIWSWLSKVFSAANCQRDAPVASAMSREARCLVDLGEGFPALAGCTMTFRHLCGTGDFRAAGGVLGRRVESAYRVAGIRDLRILALADLHAGAIIVSGGGRMRPGDPFRAPGGPAGPEAEKGSAGTLPVLAASLLKQGDPADAWAACAEERTVRSRASGAPRGALAGGPCRRGHGDADGVPTLHREALAHRTESLGPDDPDTRMSAEAVDRLSRKRRGSEWPESRPWGAFCSSQRPARAALTCRLRRHRKGTVWQSSALP